MDNYFRIIPFVVTTMPIENMYKLLDPQEGTGNSDEYKEALNEHIVSLFRKTISLIRKTMEDDEGKRLSSLMNAASILATHIAISANALPRLRLHLFSTLYLKMIGFEWEPSVLFRLSKILAWLLSGPKFEELREIEYRDIAIYALNRFIKDLRSHCKILEHSE